MTPAVPAYSGPELANPVMFNPGQCVIWLCTAEPECRGHCRKHYRQGLAEGGFAPGVSKPVVAPKCKIPGCDRLGYGEHRGLGLCKACYHREYRKRPEAKATIKAYNDSRREAKKEYAKAHYAANRAEILKRKRARDKVKRARDRAERMAAKQAAA